MWSRRMITERLVPKRNSEVNVHSAGVRPKAHVNIRSKRVFRLRPAPDGQQVHIVRSVSTKHVGVKRFAESTAGSRISSDPDAHVVVVHKRRRLLRFSGTVTKVEVEFVVLRANTIRRPKVKTVTSIIEVELEVCIA